MKHILIIASNGSSLINFRLNLIKDLLGKGHKVSVASPTTSFPKNFQKVLQNLNIRIYNFSLSSTGLNILKDFLSCVQIYKIINNSKPDIIISYTIKPVIYTGLILMFLKKIIYYPMITGLGYAFIDRHSIKHKILKYITVKLYKLGLKNFEKVIFQNEDDRSLFVKLKLIKNKSLTCIVNGSGVDLNAYPFSKLPPDPIFLMISRLLIDKGVREYFQAAKIVRSSYPNAQFKLVGYFDKNPACISHDELKSWIEDGSIQYLGEIESVQAILKSSRYFVLPSYREGTPRSILEALSSGRPIITTDVAGCRETVVHEKNGLLVPVKDQVALANAMMKMIEKSDEKIEYMARESFLIAKNKYEINKVNKSIIEIMNLS